MRATDATISRRISGSSRDSLARELPRTVVVREAWMSAWFDLPAYTKIDSRAIAAKTREAGIDRVKVTSQKKIHQDKKIK